MSASIPNPTVATFATRVTASRERSARVVVRSSTLCFTAGSACVVPAHNSGPCRYRTLARANQVARTGNTTSDQPSRHDPFPRVGALDAPLGEGGGQPFEIVHGDVQRRGTERSHPDTRDEVQPDAPVVRSPERDVSMA